MEVKHMRISRLVLLILISVIFLSVNYHTLPNESRFSNDECRPALTTFLLSSRYPPTAEELALNMEKPEIQTLYIPEGFEQQSLFSYPDKFIELLKQDLINHGISQEFIHTANTADIIIRFNLDMISLAENSLYIEATMAMKRKGVTETKHYNENYTDVIDSQERLSAATEVVSEQLLKNIARDIYSFLCPAGKLNEQKS